MNIDEVWNKFGILTNKSKDEFMESSEQFETFYNSLPANKQAEIQDAVREFVKSLDVGYAIEERLARQHKLLTLTKQTDKTLQEFLNASKN